MLEPWDSTQDELHQVADAVADGIIQARPFASPSEIAHIRDAQNQALFGSAALHDSSAQLQWSDAAAEELFARVYSRAGVRSRNFRVWLVGQSIKQRGDRDEVLATEKRVMTVFVDPGERNEKGDLVSQHQKVRVLHVRDF